MYNIYTFCVWKLPLTEFFHNAPGKSNLQKKLLKENPILGLLQNYSIDSLEFSFLKINRLSNMSQKLSMSHGRDRKFKKEYIWLEKNSIENIVVGDEINNKWSSDISPTTNCKLQIV